MNETSRSSATGATIDERTVFVVDDHPAYRRAIGSVIQMTPGTRLIGTAASGAEALERVAIALPDLVLMDVHLGNISGLDVTRRLIEGSPELRVLLISTMTEDDLPADVATCGAVGFVRKDRFGPSVLAEACGFAL